MTNDLKTHLASNPQLTHVFVNDKNEWQFHERAGYDKVLTRDEVLAMEIPEEEPEQIEVEDVQKVEKVKVVKEKAAPKAKAVKAPVKEKVKAAEPTKEKEEVNKIIE